MYHDQDIFLSSYQVSNGMQKKKQMDSVKGVNITMGLPIIRTSVDTGQRLKLQGKGVASPDAMVTGY
jgi:4-hydroxythreonine-4-phosphate dehydrogenase